MKISSSYEDVTGTAFPSVLLEKVAQFNVSSRCQKEVNRMYIALVIFASYTFSNVSSRCQKEVNRMYIA